MLGDVLRQLRQQRGLTREELALAAGGGISVDTIANVERGRTRPYRHTLQLLLSALGAPEAVRADVLEAWRSMSRQTGADEPSVGAPLSPLTPLIGRDRDVQHLGALLTNGARLVTLTGPGGVGKTRLALATAAALQARFAHGIVVVDLAPTRDPRLVLQTIAQALGLPDTSDQPYRDRLVAHLREAQRLIVLDNLEPVVEAAPEIADVLAACPHVRAVATSRIALRVRGEREVPVAPLTLPTAGDVADLEALAAVPSVALLLERAEGVAPGFQLTQDNAASVAAICTRLDGLPLALELAAVWLRLLPPAALLARLEHALAVLVDGPRDLPARQRTLRATIDWSYSRLAAPDQQVLRRLSVFVGGCTLAAAESVCGVDGNDGSVLTRLATLVDANLLRVAAPDDEPRFSALETIREFASEQLEESGDAEAIRRRHAEWCLELAERAEPHLISGGRGPWLARLAAENDNLRAALAWCLASPGMVETGVRLLHALLYDWYFRGHHTEGRRWAAEYLAHPDTLRMPRLQARLLYGAGKLAWTQGDIAQGCAYLEHGMRMFESVGDASGVARCCSNLVLALVIAGDPTAAFAVAEKGIAHAQAPSDAWTLAQLMNHSCQPLWLVGRPDAARQRVAEGRARYEALGDPWGVAVSYFLEGELHEGTGDDARAVEAFATSIRAMRGMGDPFGTAWTTLRHALVRMRMSELDRARDLLRETLTNARDLGHTDFVLWGLAGCAALAAHETRDQAAARLAGRAAAVFGAPSGVGGPTVAAVRATCEPILAALQARLGPRVADAEAALGQSMSIEEAIGLALAVVQDPVSA